MNLANKLTISRIVLTPVFMLFLFAGSIAGKVAALVTFTIAVFTDLLDGIVAKKRNEVTDFGKIMDPIADKILLLSAFLAFVEMKLIPAWMVVVIVFREVTITTLRIFALTKGSVIPADGGGKHKTASQSFSIFAILIFLILREVGMKAFGFWNEGIERIYRDTIFILMLITVMLTLISGISYLARNKGIYLNAKTH